MTTLAAPPESLTDLLVARPDPMLACGASKWLRDLKKIPADAARPLAMSAPHPRAVGSYGAECMAWAKQELGLTLRWWQALAVTRQLEHDKDGALVWREIVESGPRRIGKSTRLRATALWRLMNSERLGETQLAMLVSKDLAVGKEIHRGSWRWIEEKKRRDSDAGWNVLRLGGAQEVETPGGNRWLLRAPDAAYGYDVGYGQVDESWGVDPQAITDGLEPALLERHSPQLHLTSTAHVKASSLMRRRLIAALRSADPDVLLLLWGAHPDDDIADEATWRKSSPHWSKDRRDLMARKYAAALAGQDEPEFDDPDPVRGWAAQYLNVWPLLMGGASQNAIPSWSKRNTSTPSPPPAALGLAMDLDRVWLSLAVCSTGEQKHVGPVVAPDGRVMRVRADADKSLLLGHAARISQERDIPVALDAKGPAAALLPDLEALGVSVDRGNLRRASFDDYVGACALLYDGVESGAVTHGDYLELNDAVSSAGWRGGERRVWSRKSGDVSMLEAATLALWGASQPAVESIYETRGLLTL